MRTTNLGFEPGYKQPSQTLTTSDAPWVNTYGVSVCAASNVGTSFMANEL